MLSVGQATPYDLIYKKCHMSYASDVWEDKATFQYSKTALGNSIFSVGQATPWFDIRTRNVICPMPVMYDKTKQLSSTARLP